MKWKDIQEIRNRYVKQFDRVYVEIDCQIIEGCQSQWEDGQNKYNCFCKNTDHDYEIKGYRIELCHQCDEWVIGDVESAEKFRDNLNQAIQWCKDNPLI